MEMFNGILRKMRIVQLEFHVSTYRYYRKYFELSEFIKIYIYTNVWKKRLRILFFLLNCDVNLLYNIYITFSL